MARVILSAPLYRYANGESEIRVDGSTVEEVISAAADMFPALGEKVLDGKGKLRVFLHVFVNERDIRLLQGENTPVISETKIRLVSGIAGG